MRYLLPHIPTHLLDNIFVCIPAYNEPPEAFERTISSIVNSRYPRDKLYMFFIVDGNRGRCFENCMTVLKEKVWTGESLLHKFIYFI